MVRFTIDAPGGTRKERNLTRSPKAGRFHSDCAKWRGWPDISPPPHHDVIPENHRSRTSQTRFTKPCHETGSLATTIGAEGSVKAGHS
jgi:hypothetical protein